MIEPRLPEATDSHGLEIDETAEANISAPSAVRIGMRLNGRSGKRRSKRASVIPDASPKIQKALQQMRMEHAGAFNEDQMTGAGKTADLPIPFPSKPFGLEKREEVSVLEPLLGRLTVSRKSSRTPTDYLPN